MHHNRYRYSLPRFLKQLQSLFPGHSHDLLQNPHSAFHQLLILQVNIHHQIAVDIPKPGHRSSREHIQNHLLRGSGFHTGRTRNNFRANIGHNANFRRLFQRRVGIADNRHRLRALLPCIFDRSNRKRSPSAGSDANHDIFLAGFSFCHLLRAELGRILTGLDGAH